MSKPGIPLAYGQTKDPYPEEHRTKSVPRNTEEFVEQVNKLYSIDHLVLAKRVKVYGASTYRRALLWRQLADEWSSHVEFTNRWAQLYIDVPDEKHLARVGWQHNREDVMSSDVVLLYAEPEDLLRGCLVEVGMALAWEIPVLIVGHHPNYESWCNHPGVSRVEDLSSAKQVIILHGVRR